MVAQHSQYTKCHYIVYFKMVILMLYGFYLNFKKRIYDSTWFSYCGLLWGAVVHPLKNWPQVPKKAEGDICG